MSSIGGYGTLTLSGRLSQTVLLDDDNRVRMPYNPGIATGLGCSAFARHYSRNPLFSSGYLDVSVHPVPSPVGVHGYDPMWVSPFGYFWLKRLHTAHQNFSQCTTSFLGT